MNAFLVDTGVLLEKDYPHYYAYAAAYDHLNGYYDENQYYETNIFKAVTEAKEYVEKGVDKTYAVVSKVSIAYLDDDCKYTPINEIPVEEERYLVEDIVYSVAKINGQIVEKFIKGQTDNFDISKLMINKVSHNCYEIISQEGKTEKIEDPHKYWHLYEALFMYEQKNIPVTIGVPDNDIDPYFCPTCKQSLGFEDDSNGDITDIVENGRYCHHCGQKLCCTATKDWVKYDYQFEYRLLGRCKADCDYFLGNGKRNESHLWGKTVEDHISEMKRIYNEIADDMKPEWLTMKQIEQYEKDMKMDVRKGDVHEIINYVLEEYAKYDTEFSGSFLQFVPIQLTFRDIYEAYKCIQKTINGDDVLLVSGMHTEYRDRDVHILYALECSYDEVFSKVDTLSLPSMSFENMLLLLKEYAAMHGFHLVRVMDMEKNDNDSIKDGIILELVF